jgi:hypothetical protein
MIFLLFRLIIGYFFIFKAVKYDSEAKSFIEQINTFQNLSIILFTYKNLTRE